MSDSHHVELEARVAALRAGYWLGWLSVAAVAAGLALDLPARHRGALLGLTAAAALGQAVVMLVPWRQWLAAHRGRLLLDVWSGGLIVGVAILVLVGGARANLDLLLFLILPWLATVHDGIRRAAWLAAAAGAFGLVMATASSPLPIGDVVMRAALLGAATLLAVIVAAMIRREAVAHAQADARAELEHTLLAETHHRVKNSLQTVADMLLLGRPPAPHAAAFDETAERIRAIAAVHRLLAEGGGGAIEAGSLLDAVVDAAAVNARVDADPVELDPTCAQRLGIVANELVCNAAQHGRPPISLELRSNGQTTLRVRDAGAGPEGAEERLGLRLVRSVVEGGLGGTFELARDEGATLAEVTFDTNLEAATPKEPASAQEALHADPGR